MIELRKIGFRVFFALFICMIILAATTFQVGAQANLVPDANTVPVKAVLDKFASLSSEGDNDALMEADILRGELKDLQFEAPVPVSSSDKIIMLKQNRAVGRMLLGPDKQDYYFFLAREEGNWKIESLRALALPLFVIKLKESLQTMEKRTHDQEATVQNIILITSTDADLLKWFETNKKELNYLRSLQPKFSHFDEENDGISKWRSNVPEADEIVERLFLNVAYQEDNGVFNVNIGGILDNSVGYLHAEPDAVPEISASEYIWIEPLGDGWYFYKTT